MHHVLHNKRSIEHKEGRANAYNNAPWTQHGNKQTLQQLLKYIIPDPTNHIIWRTPPQNEDTLQVTLYTLLCSTLSLSWRVSTQNTLHLNGSARQQLITRQLGRIFATYTSRQNTDKEQLILGEIKEGVEVIIRRSTKLHNLFLNRSRPVFELSYWMKTKGSSCKAWRESNQPTDNASCIRDGVIMLGMKLKRETTCQSSQFPW